MSNDKQERIVCAAIKVSLVKDGYQGINIVTGVNYKSIVEGGLISEISHPTYCNIFIQGFITNKNRFVDPKEAMGIAIGAGQILYLNELLDAYINDVIGSRVINPQARMILNAWEHQRKMAECRGLKPEDLY